MGPREISYKKVLSGIKGFKLNTGVEYVYEN
jgi:hypothetical protein